MFVRKKFNRSGSISVVVVSKSQAKFTGIKKLVVAKSEEAADELFQKARHRLIVSDGGYPHSYSLFNGSQYEGFR
jgi:hypothetical protein